MKIEANELTIKSDRNYNYLYNFSYNFCDGVYFLLANDYMPTVLFDCLSGINNNYLGDIKINGTDRKKLENQNLKISYLKKVPVLLENKSVLENLYYLKKINNEQVNKDFIDISYVYLKEFGLDKLAKTKVKKLSSEQKFALCLVRSLLKNSNIVLIEEIENLQTFQKFLSLWRMHCLGAGEQSGGVVVVKMTPNFGYFNDCKVLKFCFGSCLGELCFKDEMKNPTDYFSYFYAKNALKFDFKNSTYNKTIELPNANEGEDFFIVDGFKFDALTGMRIVD